MLSIESFKVKGVEITIAVLWDEKIHGIAYSLNDRKFAGERILEVVRFLGRRGILTSTEVKKSEYPKIVYEVLVGNIGNPEGFEYLSLKGLTSFEKKVYEWLVKNVKRGEVITYGELARALKTSPRAIGGAMRRNPYPIIVPCHRVISRENPWLYTPKPEYKKFLLEVEGWTS
ncbi:cysteine methyltransferase [Thermococcus chitonophagus]|uniref:Methylated-DNA--protein-cysteine methyltransferase n=1 Tax=Thermococcus chitonophagus TaxID=54262 RepID=A0A170T0M1_9EURY|nr:methylated-DNA--protein-cysteine methyltransferase [Thermococcus chitonophagus]ASJ16131.1 cysteine methyltransferase [Thermococcus chitonophagus]CUX78899.1 methylated-DNA-protein-cysteine methyltransferase [Thermococcus chitonophagus]